MTNKGAAVPSPWMTATEAAEYLHRGRRFVLNEIHAGRLRAAIIGGRREVLTCRDWCDAWVSERAQPMPLLPRRQRTG
jgi:excisionase family DNA binding protein